MPVEAQLAKQLVEAEGIPSVLQGYETVSSDWLLGNAIGGIQLQVPEHRMQQAMSALSEAGSFGKRSLLEPAMPTDHELETDGIDNDQDPIEDEPLTPQTGREAQIDRFYKSSIVSWVFFPFSIYSLYVFLRIKIDDQPISPAYEHRLWMGAWMQLPSLILVLLILRLWLIQFFGG
jgi:hypothetical protein